MSSPRQLPKKDNNVYQNLLSKLGINNKTTTGTIAPSAKSDKAAITGNSGSTRAPQITESEIQEIVSFTTQFGL